MEYSLRHDEDSRLPLYRDVLILILMEYSLRLLVNGQLLHPVHCLNPYSNGI